MINRKGMQTTGIRFSGTSKKELPSIPNHPKEEAGAGKTWNEAVSLWLEETCTKTTHEEDKKKLEWLKPFLGELALSAINSQVITQVRSASAKVITRNGLGRTQSTTNRYLALLRSILIKAKDEWEWLERIPKIKLFKEPPGRVRFLSPEEAKRLLDELPEHLLAVIRFDLATGLRLSNVAKLKWSDIDFKHQHAWVEARDSKSRKSIAIDLNSDAIQALKGELGKHSERVFTYKGKPLDNLNTRAWRNALKRAGISDFRFHDLRHTWASWHRQNGTPAHELQVMGGWSSSVMVERYAHLGKDVIAGASKRIESIIPK
jgi:integrase